MFALAFLHNIEQSDFFAILGEANRFPGLDSSIPGDGAPSFLVDFLFFFVGYSAFD